MESHKTIHPGKRLRTEWFEKTGLTVTKAAQELDITRQALNNVLNGRSRISTEMALRIERFSGLRAETIQRWQQEFDLAQGALNKTTRIRVGGHPLFLTSADLVAWAGTIDARYALPLLIRHLIRVTAPQATQVDFPAGEDAQRPGWDGRVDNPQKTDYVPQGSSVWELSTEENPASKMDRDLKKRSENPLGADPRNSTLVMLTLRRFGQKRKWAKAKQAEGLWKQVIVYDAVDLEQWMELAPHVAIWLSRRTGLRPVGVQSLEAFWDEYSKSTTPALTPEILLARREPNLEHKTAEQSASEWLRSGSGVIRILADSSDEALAFVASVAKTEDPIGKQGVLTDIIVVDSVDQARQLMAVSLPLTFAWRIEDLSLLGSVVDRGHRAVLPISRTSAGAESAEVKLLPLNRQKFSSAIEASLRFAEKACSTEGKAVLNGAERNFERKTDEQRRAKSQKLAADSGFSLVVYRRQNAAVGAATTPRWAESHTGGDLVPFLLAGAWNESSEKDKSVVAELAGQDYRSIARMLASYRSQADAPVRQIGDEWSLVSSLDAWSLLAKFITNEDLIRYRKIVVQVLGEVDPTLSMKPTERWTAALQLQGKREQYSESLRKGIANSLILLSTVAEYAGLSVGSSAANFCKEVEWELIGRSPSRELWASIATYLPALAEAAPEYFLEAVRNDLLSPSGSLTTLFEAEPGPFASSARYPPLLWALEQLAWFPELMGNVAGILAKLCRMFPTTPLGNSPKKSLTAIFCCWHPNTTASLEERLKAIDGLLDKEEGIMWPILLDLLPTIHGGVGHDAAEPRWRTKPDQARLTWPDLWKAYDEVILRALNAAGTQHDRLRALLDKVVAWQPHQRGLLVERIADFENSIDDTGARQALWSRLRDFIGDCRTYQRLAEEDLQPFTDLLERLSPTNAIDKHLWLFDKDLPALTLPQTRHTGDLRNVEERMKETSTARETAACEIFDCSGLDGIEFLASSAKLPWEVGIAAAKLELSDNIDVQLVERLLNGSTPNVVHAGICFVSQSNETRGGAWAESILAAPSFQAWPVSAKAAFCRGLPEGENTWNIAAGLGPEVEREYWSAVPIAIIRFSRNEDAEFALAKLLEVDRALDALDQAGFNPERISSQLLMSVMEQSIKALSKLSEFNSGTLDWGIERILARLRETNEIPRSEIGRLELAYLPILGHTHNPVVLHESLAEDPNLFAEVVANAFPPDSHDGTEMRQHDDRAQNRARLALQWLSNWGKVPGTGPDGIIDTSVLRSWIDQARVACAERDRSKIGDRQIGRVLAYAPPDIDGIWPAKAVRRVIEKIESPELESGLLSGRVNLRGVVTKSPVEGGRAERELAKRYKDNARLIAAEAPRTASLLRGLAETYEHFGRFDDISAEANGFV